MGLLNYVGMSLLKLYFPIFNLKLKNTRVAFFPGIYKDVNLCSSEIYLLSGN